MIWILGYHDVEMMMVDRCLDSNMGVATNIMSHMIIDLKLIICHIYIPIIENKSIMWLMLDEDIINRIHSFALQVDIRCDIGCGVDITCERMCVHSSCIALRSCSVDQRLVRPVIGEM